MDSVVAMRTLRVWGFLFLLVVCSVAPAYAADDYANCNNTTVQQTYCETASQASAAVRAYLEARGSDPRDTFCTPHWQYDAQGRPAMVMQVRKRYQYTETCADGSLWAIRYVGAPASCPSGTTFDPLTGKCKTECGVGEWPDPTNPGQCLSQAKCLSRNSSLGNEPRSGDSDFYCYGGCRYALDSSAGVVRTTAPGGATLYSGLWRYTGEQCGTEPPPPPDEEPGDPPKKQHCEPVAGQTLCIKPDGQHCYSASTGRQICWKPGETGDKPDGDTLQRRVAGPTEIPPNTQLPNGDTLTRSGNPITTTTTTNNTTITTTTTNYRTQNGTNAGNTNSGENADGTDDGEPDGEGDNGVAGDGCDKPPTCTLGESIGCAILMQTWKNDCTLRTAIAPNESDEPSDLSALDGFEQARQNLFDSEGEGVPGLDDIDSGGWAPSGSCPIAFSFTFWGRSYNLNDSRLCEVLDALAALVLVLGGIHSAYIFASGSRK